MIFLGQICILSRDEYWMWVPRRGMNARAGRRFEFVYLQRTAWDNSKHRPTENSTEAATQLIDTGCPEYIAVSASILKLVILWNTPNTWSVLNLNRIDSYTLLTGVSQKRLYKYLQWQNIHPCVQSCRKGYSSSFNGIFWVQCVVWLGRLLIVGVISQSWCSS